MKKVFCILMFMFPVVGFAQWTALSSGTTGNLSSIFFTDANTGYAAGSTQDEYPLIIKTTDGGITWNELSSGISGYAIIYSIFFNNADTGYIVCWEEIISPKGIILKTINGGTVWNPLSSGNNFNLNSVYFINANTGFAVGQMGNLFKTNNGGALWIDQSQETGYNLNSVYFINADTGYTAGGDLWDAEDGPMNGGILKTTDGGNQWTSIAAGEYALQSVYFTDANTGYAVGMWWQKVNAEECSQGTVILKTTNGGADWVNQSSGIPDQYTSISNDFIDNLYSVYFTNADTGYAVGDSGRIIKTTDGGTNWIRQTSGTTSTLNSVFFVGRDTGYVAGSNGIILKTTNGGGYPAGLNKLPSKPNTIKIYPNPSSDRVTIETSAISTQNQLSIMNLSGQEVLTSQLTKASIIIDISGLPCGVYVVKLIGSKGMQMGKFVKE